MFENIIAKIFCEAGYAIKQDVQLEQRSGDIDIVAEKEGNSYCIEVKYSQLIEKAAGRIYTIGRSCGMTPILVTAFKIDEKKRSHYQEEYPDLILIDIANLLFAVQYRTELRNELIAILPFTVDDIEPQKGFVQFDSLQHDDYTNTLIQEMVLCEAGRPFARSYEVLCRKLLENVFSEDLALWSEQQKSNNDLYRFDLLCRIKDENQKTFWSILERYFRSKYVIFEFKNYKEPILHLFESAIDLLSFATIRKLNGMDWRKDHLLSLAGVYQPRDKIEESAVPLALTQYLRDHPEIKTIILRLDNDRAGRLAAKALMTVLPKDYTIDARFPPRGKDYNDCLCMHLGIPITRSKEKNQER